MRKWTQDEEEKLAELYIQGENIHTITRILNRSYEAVKSKILKLGIRRPDGHISSPKFWSPEKDKIIIEEYPTTPTKELAKKLGVTIYSLYHRAQDLKMTKKLRGRGVIAGQWFSPTVEKVPSDEIAYIAGIFDGEGTLCISKTSGKNLGPAFAITTTNIGLRDFLLKRIGGSSYTEMRHKNKLNEKDCYSVYVKSAEKVKVLCGILLPYLKVKKRQAELMIEFCKLKLDPKRDREKEMYLRDKMCHLNR